MADMQQVGSLMLADWQKASGTEGAAIIAEYTKLRAKK
jgi:hypothetical protein